MTNSRANNGSTQTRTEAARKALRRKVVFRIVPYVEFEALVCCRLSQDAFDGAKNVPAVGQSQQHCHKQSCHRDG